MDNKILKLKQFIADSKKIVVFSGAGISTLSNIPDFRSSDGLYNQDTNLKFSPEEIISHTFFNKHPQEFYKFYFEKMVYPNALPNIAHKYFADLEKNKTVTIVTQNIDNIHQMAGSSNVIELHGNVNRNYCQKCHKFYSLNDIYKDRKYICDCGGIIKPDVVLYEESLNYNDITRAINAIRNCDMLIVIGTSLMVYPAAGFINYYNKDKLILINRDTTPYDDKADIVIHDDIKDVIEQLQK
ncbi:TPA: NAD-dependent protein deacylase [Candidatus Avacholeplasma faecigallinarum]|nr:NAD-dependent protein deacylase [Candidatus Avacholeplasma faecigallinarum]